MSALASPSARLIARPTVRLIVRLIARAIGRLGVRWLAVLACCAALAPWPVQAQHAHRAGPPPGAPHDVGPNRWWDGAHGHAHAYPVPGYRVPAPPPAARWVVHGGVRYGFHQGVWYAPQRGGYHVVRPPYGVVIGGLPAFATVLTIGTATYWYADGIYYRPAPGGYEVVQPPAEAQMAGSSTQAAGPDRLYVYPRQGQSPEKQAGDEYDCHRWAASQSGFDPTAQAVGSASDSARQADYGRAQAACLDGRGYTVK